jgi:tetratricopeptide (TPR) repeat protein
MRYLRLLLLIGLFLGPAVSAQSTPTGDTQEQIATLEAMATQVSVQLTELQDLATQANNDVNNTFNLLGLLEAFSFVITVVGGAAAIVGVTRFISAQQDLQEARQRFEDEIEKSSKRLEEENAHREMEFATLRESLEKSTGNATLALSFLPLGEGQYKSGDFNGALDIYRRALALDPDNPIINYRLGYVATQSGRLEDAERYLQEALEIEPDFPPALATLGYVYRRRGEKMDEGIDRVVMLNKAEQHLVRALKLAPKLVDEEGESWWGSLGGLYRRRGQVDQAIYAYEQAADVMPNSSYAFSNLALLFMQQRNREKMLETYAQVEKLAANEVQADVDNYWAYTDLVTSRLALGRIDEAEQALDSVLRTTPDDSPYVLEALLDTLRRLADSLSEREAAPVRQFHQRLEAYVAQKKQEAEVQARETISEAAMGD